MIFVPCSTVLRFDSCSLESSVESSWLSTHLVGGKVAEDFRFF